MNGRDFLDGARAERAVIAAWLRKHTHLRALAQLIEDDVCSKPAAEQAAYCTKHGISVPSLGAKA